MGAGDQLDHGAAKRRAGGQIAAAGQHQRRGGDLRQAVGRVVIDEGVQVALQVLGRLLVRNASTSSTNWATVPSLWARAV
jgi:hypothetical protein